MSLLVFGVGINKIKVISERRYRTIDFNLIPQKNHLIHIPLSPCNLTHLLVTAQFAVISAVNTSYIIMQFHCKAPRAENERLNEKRGRIY